MKKQNLFLTLAIALVSAITSLHALRVGPLEITPGDSDACTQAPFFELIQAAWAHDRPYQLAIAQSAGRYYPFDVNELGRQFGMNNFNNPLTRAPIENIQIYDIAKSADSEDVEQAAVNINADRANAFNIALGAAPAPVVPVPAQLVIPAHVTDISQIVHRFNLATNTLDLANTGITQIDGIVFTQMAQQLPNLQILLLNETPLRELPPEVRNLANLQQLDLSRTQLTQLPPEIGRLANLRELWLNNTPLGELPPEIGNLANLQELLLYGTPVHELPPELGSLANLQELWLFDTPLTQLPPEIGGLANLRVLHLFGTQLTQLPPEIGRLANLQQLSLYGTPVHELPPEIGNLANLQRLSLENTPLRELPHEIGSLANLRELWLNETPLSRRDDWQNIRAQLQAQLPNTIIYPG